MKSRTQAAKEIESDSLEGRIIASDFYVYCMHSGPSMDMMRDFVLSVPCNLDTSIDSDEVASSYHRSSLRCICT